VDAWDKPPASGGDSEGAPEPTKYTMFEALAGELCKEYGLTPSRYLGTPDSMSQIEAFGVDYTCFTAFTKYTGVIEQAKSIMQERNRGDRPGQARSPATRRTAKGGSDAYMKRKMERING